MRDSQGSEMGGSRAERTQGDAGTLGNGSSIKLEVEVCSSLMAKPRTTEKQERIVFGSELGARLPD